MAISLIPVFSIIIPIFNKDKYIKGCIDSITAQTFKDFEVIAINDGSTDDSLAILQSVKDDRIVLVDVPNGGVSCARNIGLNKARGEYVTFIDADDSIEPDYLERYHALITTLSCDIITGGLMAINPQGETNTVNSKLSPGLYAKSTFCEHFIPEMFNNHGVFGFVAAKFIKRELLVKNHLCFNQNIKLAEDLDFWSRAYLLAANVAITDYAGYKYITGTENSSVHLIGQQMTQLDLWLRIIEDYAPNRGSFRSLVLQKINNIIEAHLLELRQLSPVHIFKTLHKIRSKTRNLAVDLKEHTSSNLQKMINAGNTIGVWGYLMLRQIYHILR